MGTYMTCERPIGTQDAGWYLADQLAALAWLASGGTVAGLDEAQQRILVALDELEAAG